MATARELAVSFLYRQLGWVATFRDDHPDEAGPERDGRVAGALGALRAIGLLGADEAEAWRPRLMGAGVERPVPSDRTRRAAGELLQDLLEAVPVDDERRGVDFMRFEGALSALQAVGAASGDWYDQLARRMGWATADEVSERNEGAAERDLRDVLAGPDEALDGVRVLCALRFDDGVSVLLRVEDGDDPFEDDPFDFELVDDVGTSYSSSGGGGGGREMKISYSTPVPTDATWLELRRVSTAIGFSPTAAIGSPHGRSCFLPAGGHRFSPYCWVRGGRRGAERVARGGAARAAARTVRRGAPPPCRRSPGRGGSSLPRR